MNKYVAIACLIAFLLPGLVLAQPNPEREKAVHEALQKLDFMVGTWKGEGTMMRGPNEKSSSKVVEEVSFKLQDSILVMEGLGTIELPNGKTQVVHDAMGIISFDPETKQYQLRTYRSGGEQLDPKVEVSENKIVWSFEQPDVGTIRFILEITDDKWTEVGAMTRDGGKNWFPFFEMNLTKQ